MGNVTKLSDHENATSRHWTPEQMLLDEAARIRRGERKANKAVVIFLDDEDGEYAVGWANAKMSRDEMVLLAEVFKAARLREMLD